jgi:elongation factor P--(R)-beta-lysine ligase
MTASGEEWRPSISRTRLLERAALLRRAREFFAARAVLEVDTPILVNAPVSDVHIHSARVQLAAQPGGALLAALDSRATAATPAAPPTPGAPATPVAAAAAPLFLHTSPEYAMKRLLAAGSGDIYQICHVVRGLECGRLHNPEFTLIEWYRLGFTLGQLMDEVEALVRALLGPAAASRRSERLSYRDAFVRELGLDPLSASADTLAATAQPLGFRPGAACGRDEWLELLMAARIGPRLGHNALTFVYGYPASQAALARLDPLDARVAERFELYCEGLELANGFHELASAAEQRARFEHDNTERRRRGLPVAALDERLLAALAAGLPDCAGVALGFERTLMLATGAERIEDVMPFPTARA